MHTNYPKHLPRFSYVGQHQYSLTFCTFERRKAFESAENVKAAWSQILRASGEYHMDVIAYCFMPDHLHLVAQGAREDADLKKFIARAKQYSGDEHSQRTGHRLWQRYGYEHVIRDDERLDQVVRYVLENPLRPVFVSSVCIRGQGGCHAPALPPSSSHGITVGRTSDRLRNPASAVRPWAAPLMGRLRPDGTIDPSCIS